MIKFQRSTPHLDTALSKAQPLALIKVSTISLLAVAISACAPIEVQQPRTDIALPSVWSKHDYVVQDTASLRLNRDTSLTAEQVSHPINHGFNDPALAALISEGLQNNLSLQQARLRIAMAEQGLMSANADKGPNVYASAGAGRYNTSDESYPAGSAATYNDFQLAGNISYTIDIWGRQAALVDAQAAAVHAAEAAQSSAQLSLTAAIARAFYIAKFSQAQLASLIALRDIESQRLEAISNQVSLGFETADLLTEANLDAISIDNQIVIAKANNLANQRALAHLVGREPNRYVSGVELGKTPLDKLDIPWLAPGLPSELIARRPDITLAQAELDAAYAQAKVASSAHLPSFALTSQLGLKSLALGQFLSTPAIFWNLASNATTTLFDGGKIKAEQTRQDLALEQTELAYREQVYLAFKQTQDALANYQSQHQQWRNQVKLLENQHRLYQQEQSRFELGQTSPLVTMAVKKAWLSAQLAYVSSRFHLLNASVDIYQALGGPAATHAK